MESITSDFYRIDSLVDLLKNHELERRRPRRLWLRRLALLENLNNYYRFSVGMARLFQDAVFRQTEQLEKNLSTDDFDNKLHAGAIAFYGLSRVCLESARMLSEDAVLYASSEEKADALQEHRDRYASWARTVINKRNKIAAHPHEAREMFLGPKRWYNDGTVIFKGVDLEHITIPEKEYSLEPAKDLRELRKYIEEVTEHLRSVYEINSD